MITLEEAKSDGHQIYRTAWVFDVKVNPERRMIDEFRARMVVQGSKALVGYDVFDTSSPTAPAYFIKMQFAYAAYHELDLFHVDTKAAYNSGKLRQDDLLRVYPPPGVHLGKAPNGSPFVWHCQRPIEGARQAGNRFHVYRNEIITKLA